MVDVRSERRSEAGCSTYPSFGTAGSRKAELCAAHARAGMVDVRSKRCSEKGCSTTPSFGAAGGRKAEFCAAHARAGMVDVRSKRCSEKGCSTYPSFGAAGSRKAEVCAAHARAGMVNVTSKRCSKAGCFTRPSFGAAGSRDAEFCAAHAQAGMGNVTSRRCSMAGRFARPSFGAAGSRKAEFCAAHASAGMASVNGDECASLHHSNLVGENANFCHHASYGLVRGSDPTKHVREKTTASDGLVAGKTGVGIDDAGTKSNYPPNGGLNTNDGGRGAESRTSSRVIRVWRRGANSTTASPSPSRQPPGSVASDRFTRGGSGMRMKIKMEGTVAPVRVFEGIRTSKLVTARPGNCDSTSGSSRTSRSSSITNGNNTKRLRQMAQVLPVLDVAAEDDVMSEEDGADVKFELNVSAPSRHVSAASSRLRKR